MCHWDERDCVYVCITDVWVREGVCVCVSLMRLPRFCLDVVYFMLVQCLCLHTCTTACWSMCAAVCVCVCFAHSTVCMLPLVLRQVFRIFHVPCVCVRVSYARQSGGGSGIVGEMSSNVPGVCVVCVYTMCQ